MPCTIRKVADDELEQWRELFSLWRTHPYALKFAQTLSSRFKNKVRKNTDIDFVKLDADDILGTIFTELMAIISHSYVIEEVADDPTAKKLLILADDKGYIYHHITLMCKHALSLKVGFEKVNYVWLQDYKEEAVDDVGLDDFPLSVEEAKKLSQLIDEAKSNKDADRFLTSNLAPFLAPFFSQSVLSALVVRLLLLVLHLFNSPKSAISNPFITNDLGKFDRNLVSINPFFKAWVGVDKGYSPTMEMGREIIALKEIQKSRRQANWGQKIDPLSNREKTTFHLYESHLLEAWQEKSLIMLAKVLNDESPLFAPTVLYFFNFLNNVKRSNRYIVNGNKAGDLKLLNKQQSEFISENAQSQDDVLNEALIKVGQYNDRSSGESLPINLFQRAFKKKNRRDACFLRGSSFFLFKLTGIQSSAMENPHIEKLLLQYLIHDTTVGFDTEVQSS